MRILIDKTLLKRKVGNKLKTSSSGCSTVGIAVAFRFKTNWVRIQSPAFLIEQLYAVNCFLTRQK